MKNGKIKKNVGKKKAKNECEEIVGQSTSPPSGNLVDGLPLVCNSTRAVVYEIEKGVQQNGTTPPKNDLVGDILLNELEKKSQDTLWHVLWRFTGSLPNHENIMKNIGSMTSQFFENVVFCFFGKLKKIKKNDKE